MTTEDSSSISGTGFGELGHDVHRLPLPLDDFNGKKGRNIGESFC
jgi:hypothetical protein